MKPSNSQFIAAFKEAKLNPSDDLRAAFLDDFRPYLTKLTEQYFGKKFSAKLGNSDVVQSAIIGALNDFSSCKATNEIEFKGWLKRILLNDISNIVRNLTREKRDVRREITGVKSTHLVDDAKSPGSQFVDNEDAKRLETALQCLSEREQYVIQYRNRDRLPFTEIAEKLGLSPDAARMLWHRAIQKLAKKLRADEE